MYVILWWITLVKGWGVGIVFHSRYCDLSVTLFYGLVVQVSGNLLIHFLQFFSKFYDVSIVHCLHYEVLLSHRGC